MRNEAIRDALKVWLYAGAVLLTGAAIAPYLYNLGMALAEVTAHRQTTGLLERLGAAFGRWEFPSFFKSGLLLAAALLFTPFAAWLRLGNGPPHLQGKPWTLRLPESLILPDRGQPLAKNGNGPVQFLAGLLLASGLLLLIGYALTHTGSFTWIQPAPHPGAGLFRLAASAVLLAAVQEVLFRGIAMGVFLRAAPPAAAIAAGALLFALFQFFLHLPATASVPDPEATTAGFHLLRSETARLADPFVAVGQCLPLLAAGLVFSYARWRTASLWLPIGLHSGWILANGLFLSFAAPVPREDPIARLLAGGLLQHGLIPLTGVILAGALVHFLTASDGKSSAPSV